MVGDMGRKKPRGVHDVGVEVEIKKAFIEERYEGVGVGSEQRVVLGRSVVLTMKDGKRQGFQPSGA